MFRVVVNLSGDFAAKRFQFMRKSRATAKLLAEELTRSGFWIPRRRPKTFIPPSRIRLIEVTPIVDDREP